jgi:hypothetical protein
MRAARTAAVRSALRNATANASSWRLRTANCAAPIASADGRAGMIGIVPACRVPNRFAISIPRAISGMNVDARRTRRNDTGDSVT